jgi:hypothetical protein
LPQPADVEEKVEAGKLMPERAAAKFCIWLELPQTLVSIVMQRAASSTE